MKINPRFYLGGCLNNENYRQSEFSWKDRWLFDMIPSAMPVQVKGFSVRTKITQPALKSDFFIHTQPALFEKGISAHC
ncbi:hypothetical protein SY86_10005 [Erwinia tracheiphila]|uniref:Uncharacterized protein n=1 Tax=Erwinia tracheiphila TaxID=65700 RepID=A0A0M2K9R3_9GAMM|nr:hypothetical protein ETR_21792 [Erwinia tracheiphila PSU-1]KKF35679.1 hypothetical protein SY86_10005 [Erwinia tracheiphila]